MRNKKDLFFTLVFLGSAFYFANCVTRREPVLTLQKESIDIIKHLDEAEKDLRKEPPELEHARIHLEQTRESYGKIEDLDQYHTSRLEGCIADLDSNTADELEIVRSERRYFEQVSNGNQEVIVQEYLFPKAAQLSGVIISIFACVYCLGCYVRGRFRKEEIKE
ncbi:hypothetical protein ACFLZN_00545 [Nanoarchaeota archaeon]